MGTENLISQMRETRCAAYDMISESHHCAQKMYKFIGMQYELMGLCSSSQFASCCEASKSIFQEMEEHCKKLEEIHKTIAQILEHYECAMPLSLGDDNE